MASRSVTIDRAYFETLVRRSNLLNDDPSIADPVVVSKRDLDELLDVSGRFASLVKSLLIAGVASADLDALCNPVENPYSTVVDPQDGASRRYDEAFGHGFGGPRDGGAPVASAAPTAASSIVSHVARHRGQPDTLSSPAFGESRSIRPPPGLGPWPSWDTHTPPEADEDAMSSGPLTLVASRTPLWRRRRSSDRSVGRELYAFHSLGLADDKAKPEPTQHQPEPHEHQDDHELHVQRPRTMQIPPTGQRTVYIPSLAEGTTHADVTAVVRGGQLADLFVRTASNNNRTRRPGCSVISFVQPDAAAAFIDFVGAHDMRINGRRIEARWAENQYYFKSFVVGKIVRENATRNLVIRRCNARIDEATIRDQLDHIDSIVVIKVQFTGSSCYIETNSVKNAIYAQTCLMSRSLYKGSKIDFAADECGQPLPSPSPAAANPEVPNRTMAPSGDENAPPASRFQSARLRQLPKQLTPPKQERLAPTASRKPTFNRFDVLVMGSGASGGGGDDDEAAATD